jgi:hypothetical protein
MRILMGKAFSSGGSAQYLPEICRYWLRGLGGSGGMGSKEDSEHANANRISTNK